MEKLLYDYLDKLTNTGKIFSVVFTKKSTGEERTMVARRGVTKNQTGAGLKFDLREKNLINVWDMQKGDYRCFNTNAVKQIKVNGAVIVRDELLKQL